MEKKNPLHTGFLTVSKFKGKLVKQSFHFPSLCTFQYNTSFPGLLPKYIWTRLDTRNYLHCHKNHMYMSTMIQIYILYAFLKYIPIRTDIKYIQKDKIYISLVYILYTCTNIYIVVSIYFIYMCIYIIIGIYFIYFSHDLVQILP